MTTTTTATTTSLTTFTYHLYLKPFSKRFPSFPSLFHEYISLSLILLFVFSFFLFYRSIGLEFYINNFVTYNSLLSKFVEYSKNRFVFGVQETRLDLNSICLNWFYYFFRIRCFQYPACQWYKCNLKCLTFHVFIVVYKLLNTSTFWWSKSIAQ